MRATPLWIVTACGLVLSSSPLAVAQAPQAQAAQDKKDKRRPNQVQETGVADRVPTESEAAAESDAAVATFGKRVEAVTIRPLAGGGISAELDESFMEAQTVMLAPDGTLVFGHFTGLGHAERAVLTSAPPPALPAKNGPVVLEEKE